MRMLRNPPSPHLAPSPPAPPPPPPPPPKKKKEKKENRGKNKPYYSTIAPFCHIKVLANEDTMLRTHCCSWLFLCCANRGYICCGHKMVLRGQTGKHLCPQQCVRNIMSSFATAFRSRNAQNMTRYFTVEQGKNMDRKRSNKMGFLNQ